MLEAIFYNVGDGDCALIRETGKDGAHTLLFDTGRPHIEYVNGSGRRPAAAHLMREGIERIDLMALSHPHFDHIGGALAILRHIPVAALTAPYLPEDGARWIEAPDCGEKTVVGLCDALNMLSDIRTDAKARGCVISTAREEAFRLGSMKLRTFLTDRELYARQRSAFDALYRGETLPCDELCAISKERNCSSLMMRVEYAGRSILLTGDAYAEYWEDREMEACDILKVPHHGDKKATTEKLIAMLSPKYAVISCENNAESKKERPTAETLDTLRRHGAETFITENRPVADIPAETHGAIRFTIDDGGSISFARQ